MERGTNPLVLQGSDVDSRAAIAVFYTVMAHCACTLAAEEEEDSASLCLNMAMSMMEPAAQAVCGLVADPMNTRMVDLLAQLLHEARATLSSAVEKQRVASCAAACLPQVSHQSVVQQLTPFTVDLPSDGEVHESADLTAIQEAAILEPWFHIIPPW